MICNYNGKEYSTKVLSHYCLYIKIDLLMLSPANLNKIRRTFELRYLVHNNCLNVAFGVIILKR